MSPTKKPKLSVAARGTTDPQTTFSRFMASPLAVSETSDIPDRIARLLTESDGESRGTWLDRSAVRIPVAMCPGPLR